MSDELLDIDEADERKIDDSTLKMINLSDRYITPLATSFLLIGGTALFGLVLLLKKGFSFYNLELARVVFWIGIATFGIASIISAINLIDLHTLIKRVSEKPSRPNLEQVLAKYSRILGSLTAAFGTLAIGLLSYILWSILDVFGFWI